MTNFDEHLAGQLNQRDADEAASVRESNAVISREIKAELQRLIMHVADMEFSKSPLDEAEGIAASAKIIASYAEAMQ